MQVLLSVLLSASVLCAGWALLDLLGGGLQSSEEAEAQRRLSLDA